MTSIRMPRAAIAFAATLGLAFAAPAFAQSTPGSSSGSSGSSNQQAGSQGSNQGSQTPHAMSQAKLRQQLTQAGFTDVQILDAAYLVRAKTGDGNTVMMMIDPPNMGMQGSAASGSSTGGKPNASGGGQSR